MAGRAFLAAAQGLTGLGQFLRQSKLQEDEQARLAAEDQQEQERWNTQVGWRNADTARADQYRQQDNERAGLYRQQDIERENARLAAEQARRETEYLRSRTDAVADDTRDYNQQVGLTRLQASLRPPAQVPTRAPVYMQTAQGIVEMMGDGTARPVQVNGQTLMPKPTGNAGAKPTVNPAEAVDALNRLAAIGTPQADLAFKSVFQKVMDPTGVIRDEDLQRMDGTGSILQRVGSVVRGAQGKGSLTTGQKDNFVQAAGAKLGMQDPAARARELATSGKTREEARRIMLQEGYSF